MPRLARLFQYIADLFYDLYKICRDIAWECKNIPVVGNALYNFFMTMREYFWDIKDWFYDVSYEVEDWWDEITTLWDDLNDLWHYAHDWLKGKINDALNTADEAWYLAVEAYNRAKDALTEIPSWILDKLTLAYNLASTALQTVPAWIRAGLDSVNSSLTSLWDYAQTTVWNKAVDAWNKAADAWNHAEELFSGLNTTLKNWTLGIIEDVKTTVLSWIEDAKTLIFTWIEDAKAAVLASIAAPINLINTWFDAIQDFFNDPLGWLWGKFTDWFLGPEK